CTGAGMAAISRCAWPTNTIVSGSRPGCCGLTAWFLVSEYSSYTGKSAVAPLIPDRRATPLRAVEAWLFVAHVGYLRGNLVSHTSSAHLAGPQAGYCKVRTSAGSPVQLEWRRNCEGKREMRCYRVLIAEDIVEAAC